MAHSTFSLERVSEEEQQRKQVRGELSMRHRRRLFIAAAALILLPVSLVIAGYVYILPRAQTNVSIVAEGPARHPFLPEMNLMILCPSKARQMGLCNIDERLLHAKYTITVSPPPITRNPTVTCKVVLVPEPEPPKAMVIASITLVDKSSDFTCTHSRIGESKFEFDVAFIGDPDDLELTTHYMLFVMVDYDELLLSWIPLFTRKVSGVGIGDLCLLGFHVGRHPPPGTAESESPLGNFPSCEAALFWQRQMLGLESSCEISACQWVGAEASMLSHVTVHVVDAYGKPIQNVTVLLNTTFCCWLGGPSPSWTVHSLSETSDSDGNAAFLVTPYARYTVMVEGVVFSEITAPPPTASTTITVILT